MHRPAAISVCLAAALLAACDARERSAAERARAAKASQAVAAARDVALRVGPSPDAAATSRTEGESTTEVAKPVLAPSAGADELEAAAAKVAGAASGAGPKESAAAQAMASRLRMEALAIRLAEAERIAALAASTADEAVAARRAATSLTEGAKPGDLPKHAEAARDAARAYGAERQRVQAPADEAKAALEAIEAKIGEDNAAAAKLDAEILGLRGEAAVAPTDRALPLMLEAREKLEQAQNLRRQSSEAEMQAEQRRSEVRVAESALAGDDAAAAYLKGRAEGLSSASTAIGTAASSATAAAKELERFAGARAEAFARIRSEEFAPLAEAIDKSMESGIAAKDPIDAARLALLRARFALVQANLARAEASMATGGASTEVDARINELMGNAKAALVEAREALAGIDAERGAPMLASATGMAGALGIDLSTPAAQPPATEGGDAATGEPAASEPAPDAPAEPAAEEPAPGDAPAEPAEPAEPSGGEPAPADVPPEEQPKA